MTTSTDIANRALQLVGTRTTVASLGEQSNEAIQINLVYNAVVNWCHTADNWNFARKAAVLVAGQSFSGSPWSSTQPAPPWLHSWKLPSDFIRALYLTNNDLNSGSTSFLGEPQRFVVGTETISSVQQSVVLTNQTVANLVYISLVSDPTLWPPFFERFVVAFLAQTVTYVLTGDLELLKINKELADNYFQVASYLNRVEGLIIDDKTPEWIQAIGIPYPYRRTNSMLPTPEKDQKK